MEELDFDMFEFSTLVETVPFIPPIEIETKDQKKD